MIIAVVGGVGKDKRELVTNTLDHIHRTQGPVTKLVTTAGYGVPSFANTWATKNNISVQIYKVPRDLRNLHAGRLADQQRNYLMIQQQRPNLVLVFPGSAVADEMVDVARSNKIPYRKITPGSGEHPLRTNAIEPDLEYNKIALVLDTVTPTDIRSGGPGMGSTHDLFEHVCREAGIDFTQSLITSVFLEPPPQGQFIKNFVNSETSSLRGIRWDDTLMPFYWKYRRYHLKGGLEPEIARLRKELTSWQPRVVVAFGQVAMWALTGNSHLGKYHGQRMANDLTGYGIVYPTFSLGALHFDKTRITNVKEALTEAQKTASIKMPRALFERQCT